MRRNGRGAAALLIALGLLSTVSLPGLASAQSLPTQTPIGRTIEGDNIMYGSVLSPGGGVVSGKLVMFGGSSMISQGWRTWIYDLAANDGTWSEGQAMINPDRPESYIRLYAMGSVPLAGFIYSIGGINPDTGMTTPLGFRYDPASDQWSTMRPMDHARYGVACACVGGRIFAIGGAGEPGLGQLPVPLSVVEEYDPVADRWTPQDDLPAALSFAFCGTIGEKIFVAGGIASVGADGSPSSRSKAAFEFDPAAPAGSRWRPLRDMDEAHPSALGTGLAQGMSLVLDGQLLCVGGHYEGAPQGFPFEGIAVYDPAGDAWTYRSGPSDVAYALGVTWGSLGIAVGGEWSSQVQVAATGAADAPGPCAIAPSELAQRDAAGNEIPAGGTAVGTPITLSARAMAATGRNVRIEVQVIEGSPSFPEDGPTTKGPLVSAGAVSIMIPIEPTSTGYIWRARFIDVEGGHSNWVAFDGAPAFFAKEAPPILPPPVVPGDLGSTGSTGCIGSASTGAVGALTLLTMMGLLGVARFRA